MLEWCRVGFKKLRNQWTRGRFVSERPGRLWS